MHCVREVGLARPRTGQSDRECAVAWGIGIQICMRAASRSRIPYSSEVIQGEDALHLLLLLIVTGILLGGGGSTLALDTAGASTTVGRGEGKVNVLLGVETNDEGGDVDDLLANTICLGVSIENGEN